MKTVLSAIILVYVSSIMFAQPPVPEGRRLRVIVADKYPKGNVLIGATIGYQALIGNELDREILNREFSFTTPENDFKQSGVYAKPGAPWKWTAADGFIESAKSNGQLMRIHGPISPQCSGWVKEDNRTPAELKEMLDAYCTAIYTRYNGNPITPWIDVVNETVEGNGAWFGPKPGTDKWENPWLAIGTDDDENRTPLYIRYAFEHATKLAPLMKHVYNQHAMDRPAMERIKATIAYLRSKNLTVHALGWQAHIPMGWEKNQSNIDDLSDLITWAHSHQLEFHITEITIKMGNKGSTVKDGDDEASAETFRAVTEVLLAHRDRGVVGWNCWHVRDYMDGLGRLGLLFFPDGSPKKAYYAVQNLLENPPEAK